jgi:hypothetical protein
MMNDEFLTSTLCSGALISCARRAMANGFCVMHKNGEVQSLEFTGLEAV